MDEPPLPWPPSRAGRERHPPCDTASVTARHSRQQAFVHVITKNKILDRSVTFYCIIHEIPCCRDAGARVYTGHRQGSPKGRGKPWNTVHIHVHVNGIVHGTGSTTWFAGHIFRLIYTRSFLFPHKDLLLHKAEEDDGKKYFKLQQLFPKYHCPNT